ncbi:unnamed protein product, partial [marine sediment metagenome]
ETVALDVIKDVGIGGEYLSCEHTLRHFKEELSFSDLAWRNRRETLKQFDNFSIRDRAAKLADEMIGKEKTCISDKQRKELDLIERLWLKKNGY